MNRGGRPGPAIDLERRTYQLKEVARVSATLRADMPREAICALVAQTIHTTLGFHAAVVNVVEPGSRHFVIAATAGITDAERQRLLNDPPPVDHIVSLMRQDFQLSRSYFIGHEHKYLLEGLGSIALMAPSVPSANRAPNAWHPDDVFFVPLYSPRDGRLLGIISLDLPEDSKIPTYETVEIIELLAIHAANALDTVRLFQERNQERQALDYSLAELLAHLERMRHRDLSTPVHLRAPSLTPVAAALNDLAATLGNVLADVRDAGIAVQRQASEMHDTTTELVNGTQRQTEQIRTASAAIQHTSDELHQIARHAAASSAIASQAENIASEGREAAARAGEGMNAVREITLQAAKRIKRLGESSQDIGNVIQLVSEFASQTHLLALNAAIEAANAGEHGSGFAIVAREIRNLAQNSNEATKQIHARITGIQNETNQVAVTIEYATQQVVELSDLVTRAAASLHAIDTVIQQIIGVIATVHQTAEDQARAAATVTGTMSAVAGITGATWERVDDMRASLDRVTELANILRSKIETFRLSEGLQPTGAPVGETQPPVRNTITPAASFPAVSFPVVSQPPAPSPAASYPPRPFTHAPALDPRAASQPNASTISRTGAPVGDDMALQATMPMSAIQMPPIPPATRAPSSTPLEPTGTAPRLTVGPTPFGASGAYPIERSPEDGEPTRSGSFPSPAPLFPVSASPLTPIRLSALDDNTATETASRPAVIIPGMVVVPSDEPPMDQAAGEPDATTSGESGDETMGEMGVRVTAKIPALEPELFSTPLEQPSEVAPAAPTAPAEDEASPEAIPDPAIASASPSESSPHASEDEATNDANVPYNDDDADDADTIPVDEDTRDETAS